MIKALLVFLLLCPFIALGQFQITGKIIDKADQKPIPGASVFLSNASVGTATAPDGTFTLNSVRGGQYEFVVSMIGYETYREQIMVTENMALPVIQIAAKVNALKGVIITPDPEWEHNYAMFKEEFLGTSVYAQDCKIINPEILDLRYEKIGRVLTAGSQDFLVIENKALGYRIKYLLDSFVRDYKQGALYYAGSASFEAMRGKKSAEKRWNKNRLVAYKGSSMHFLRAVTGDRTGQEGFKVLRLIRKPNPKYNGVGNQYLEALVKTPLTEDTYAKTTDQNGLFALKFDDCLYVMFNGGEPIGDDDSNPTGIGWITTTVVFNKPYALFDNNGIFNDPQALTFDGAWGRSRMATMLPVDYEPGK